MNAVPHDLERIVVLQKRQDAALSYHDGMGEHRWCVGCDMAAILRGDA